MKKRYITFEEDLERELKDPTFKKEWDRLEPEFALIEAMIELRQATGLSQRELAKRMKVSQSEVARIELGQNVTIKTLYRVAAAADKKLKIQFV